jgi:HEAT repeat protein
MPPDQAVASLHDPDPKTRQHAADSLHSNGTAPAGVIPNLMQALQTEQDAHVRGAILIALGSWGAPDAKPIIDQAVMTAPDPDSRRWAGRALKYWMVQTGAMAQGTPLPPGWPYGQPGYPPALAK